MSRKVLNIAGFLSCGAFQKAKSALVGLSTIYPSKLSINIQEYATRDEYMLFLDDFRAKIGADSHKTSPIVWTEEGNYMGGRDDTLLWCQKMLGANGISGGAVPDSESAGSPPAAVPPNVDPWNSEHGFEYDLVVIGGGSGGLACSKEAVALGAKVAVLDYVKPSPQGSKWGLGGTCVNVGCIPKKLMHQAALLGEASKNAKGFGWSGLENGSHNWIALRESVQDHIKGLNFGYRVQLREKGVTYLNKLGRFTGPHSMELTDAKGRKQSITAARFVIATGGRPTALSIPGAEHAITSDDIFMKETAPGNTCVIGAGYVALECAGFLTGLNQGTVTVLVRSVPLRVFDKDVVGYIKDYMVHQGTRIIEGVQPTAIEKLPSGKFLVHFGDSCEEFDTVLQAIGRTPDLSGLDLAAVVSGDDSGTMAKYGGVKLDDKSGKILCMNEQTSVPHIYAIGDVIHNAPELTPVAILAGRLLAKRLFGNSAQLMNYKEIATAVFTPLELGTVGLTEKEAQDMYGESNIDAYVSAFAPLEWSITQMHSELSSFAKIVVLKEKIGDNVSEERVLGLHIAAPNAGELIQGFALALKKGLTYSELTSMVGIHPTVGEEFTVMSITKSSGASVAKTGC